jgi:hypothetical protein
MEVEMTQVTLPEEVVDRLRSAAAEEGTDVSGVLERAVEYYLAHGSRSNIPEANQGDERNLNEEERQIEREQRSYEAQHATIFASYAGQYIVMHDGQLVDHDQDRVALIQRVRARFGDEPVLITPVLPDARQHILSRSSQRAKHDE